MNDKRKKVIIIAIAIILIVVLLLFMVQKSNEQEEIQMIELSNLLNIENVEDIKKLGYETEETEEKMSSKYITGRNKYEVKANVQAGEIEGKLIYARGTQNLNIYKTEYTLNKYEDKTIKVRNIMQEFEMLCEGYMEVTDEEYKETEQLYGESSADFELPIEESIYNEGRLYSKTYKNEECEYDINFYRQDNKIICEFVKVYN